MIYKPCNNKNYYTEKSVIIKINISFERIFGTKPCNNKNYYKVLLPYKSDKMRYNIYYF